MAIKTFTTGEVLTASDTNTYLANSGLVYVTSATIGTGVSSVTVSNCFSSTYDNYKIIASGPASASADGNLIMTLNGGSTDYYGALIYGNSSGGSPLLAGNNNSSTWAFMGFSTIASGIITTIELIGPNLAEYTAIQSMYTNIGASGTFNGIRGANTQHTGFTLTPTSGTLTGGTLTVYGYRKA